MRLRTLLAILAIPAALAGCVAPGPGYYGRPAYYGAPAYGGGYYAPGYGGYYGGYRAPAYAAYAARPGWGQGGWGGGGGGGGWGGGYRPQGNPVVSGPSRPWPGNAPSRPVAPPQVTSGGSRPWR